MGGQVALEHAAVEGRAPAGQRRLLDLKSRARGEVYPTGLVGTHSERDELGASHGTERRYYRFETVNYRYFILQIGYFYLQLHFKYS